MMATTFPPALAALPADLAGGRALAWPLLVGAGLALLITALPPFAPRPDLAERLRRADLDERDRDRPAARRTGGSAVTRLLRPVMRSVGDRLRRLLVRVGFGAGAEVERDLKLIEPDTEVAEFYGQKTLYGILGFAFLPLANGLGAAPAGAWPLWAWLLVAWVGFMVPTWDLNGKARKHQRRMVLELPTVLDTLAMSMRAGLGFEQAVEELARSARGVVVDEIRAARRDARAHQRPLLEELELMAERNGVPELASVMRQLGASAQLGLQMGHILKVHARSLRADKRARLLEEGEQAIVKMILPVIVFIAPPVFVILLVPAASRLAAFLGL